jgi:DNA polymerase III delta prime subunit
VTNAKNHQPKLLPCFYSICTTFEFQINKEAISKRFKCDVWEKYHYLTDDGLALNKKIYEIIAAEP